MATRVYSRHLVSTVTCEKAWLRTGKRFSQEFAGLGYAKEMWLSMAKLLLLGLFYLFVII